MSGLWNYLFGPTTPVESLPDAKWQLVQKDGVYRFRIGSETINIDFAMGLHTTISAQLLQRLISELEGENGVAVIADHITRIQLTSPINGTKPTPATVLTMDRGTMRFTIELQQHTAISGCLKVTEDNKGTVLEFLKSLQPVTKQQE